MNLSLKTVKDWLQSHIKYQKQMLPTILVVLLAIVGVAIYIPLEAKTRSVEQSVLLKKRAIEDIQASGINVLGPAELAALQKEATDFKSGFIKMSQVAMVLSRISEEAQANHVKVISINSEAPEPLGSDAADAGDASISRLPIKISLQGNYKSFGGFFESLSDKSDKKFVVDDFQIKKASGGSSALDCSLMLSFFLKNA